MLDEFERAAIRLHMSGLAPSEIAAHLSHGNADGELEQRVHDAVVGFWAADAKAKGQEHAELMREVLG